MGTGGGGLGARGVKLGEGETCRKTACGSALFYCPLSTIHYFLRFRQAYAARPSNPAANRANVPGSGNV